jgi:membrane protein
MNWQNWIKRIYVGKDIFLAYVEHCRKDQITMVAGYLAFISLLSVVPLVTVTFSILKAFPVFDSFKLAIESYIYNNFVPTSSEQIQQYINSFVDNASQMRAIGIIVLMLVALKLISSIDTTLNKIWNTKRTRKWVISFAIYWMVLTLGPIFVGLSLGVTSYIVNIAMMADTYTPGIGDFFTKLLPIVISTAAFVLLFMIVPNTEVKFKAAFSGAVVAAVLFELSKRVFALYITSFPSYQVIYGALASIPILFLWIYVSWVVVLLGAEFTVFIDPFLDKKANTQTVDTQN